MFDLTKPKRPRVLIATPHMGQACTATFVSIMSIFRVTNPDEMEMRWEGCAGSNIAENQNVLVGLARDWEATHILFVEADMAFPGMALTWLLSHKKDIIGCSYPFKDHDLLAKNLADQKANLRYMGHELGGADILFKNLVDGETPRKVNFIPMGLTLISMEAIEQVERYRRSKVTLTMPEGMKASVFVHGEAAIEGNKRTTVTTTDSTFCHNAREAGLDIWLDARLSLMVEHIGTANYGMLPETWVPPELLKAHAR